MALRTSVLALAAVTVLLLASGGTTSARKLQDSRRYTIDLVNTFAKGRDNRVTQDVGISLDAPELMNEKDVGAEPVNPITMDPNNPRCDIDHKYAYPAFQLTDEPIGSTLRDGRRGLLSDSDDSDDDDDDDSEKKKKEKKKSSEDSEESEDSEDSEESEDSEDELEESRERSDRDTKTVEVFVGTDFQVKPVFVARVNGRVRGESQADVTGSGIEAALTLDEEVPMRTACGDWVYNSNGRYSWTFFVDNQAETRLYYYVNSAPGNSQETYDRMPVNVNYAHEYTVAGSDNNVNSDSRIDTGNRGGTVKMTLDNVIAGAGNRFEQTGRTGVNQDDTLIIG